MRVPLLTTLCLTLAAAPVAGDEPAPRRPDASWREIHAGPFRSPRLFAMPVADVVGAYQLSLSADGSLLEEVGVLSFAGVVALGFGDLAQLEYRHTGAISIEDTSAPVPAVGAQFAVPLPEWRWLPAVAVALRLGVPRRENLGATTIDETVSDLYLVGRLALAGWAAPVTLHGGLRLSKARLELGGDRSEIRERRLWLPTAGFEIATSPTARLVGELALVPRFRDDEAAGPTIDHGALGRLGIRWAVHPVFTLDGSIGYQLDMATATDAEGLVGWDIRMGGEVFVPWGAIACKATGIFCE